MNRLGIIGIVIVAVFVLVALLAPFIATHDVGATDLLVRYAAPSGAHWLALTRPDATFFRVRFLVRVSLWK
jgi:peptide/nickel transport system permease protein